METAEADFSAYRFLIADDKRFSVNLIFGMLMRCQARDIETAANGAEAIRILEDARGNIDCVLCDWNMEPVDGLEVLKSIRSGSVPDTPRDLCFIMLSGHSDEDIVKTAIAMDTNGYIVKPVSMEKLINSVNAAFANPPTLKPNQAYRTNSTVQIPEALRNSHKRIPSWVLLSKVRKDAKDLLSDRLDQIQHEAKDSVDLQSETDRPIRNKERLDLDRISPGKVLAEDIYSERGTLLLGAGTILNELLLSRLRDFSTESSNSIYFMVGDYVD
jgi:DNA-binding NarL/FixJ family response regulator